MKRTVIIGNSGSGKSFLADKVSEANGTPVIHLDELFWVPGGFNLKRPAAIVDAEIAVQLCEEVWIVEGVFGDLARQFLHRADHLIWLDLPWVDCHAGLLERGSESSKQLDAAMAAENFKKLLAWAEGYWDRTNSCSFANHRRIFADFTGDKTRVTVRPDLTAPLT